MAQTIVTKYLGPTNTKPGRIKATTTRGLSNTYSWAHDVDPDENHRMAALALAKRLGWDGVWSGGTLNNTSNVYVRKGGVEGSFVVPKEEAY